MRHLRDKVVVITGAGSGIGRATALRFAKEGSRLHLVDIDAERVAAVRDEVEALGVPAFDHAVDCADSEAVVQMARAICEREGRVDVLHNNAGVSGGGPTEQITLDEWRWMMGVNLWGVIHTIHAFLPTMIDQRRGHIVNTASMAGLMGIPMVVPYCTTKFAVVGLSEALDIELGVYGIRVSAICPGATRTNVMRDGRFEHLGGLAQQMVDGVDRIGADPDKVARAVVSVVKRHKSFVPMGADMVPLWLLRRLSISAYHGVARAATRWIRSRYPVRAASSATG